MVYSYNGYLVVLPCTLHIPPQSMVCGQSGLMAHAPRPATMGSGQSTGLVLDHTAEDVSAGALRR